MLFTGEGAKAVQDMLLSRYCSRPQFVPALSSPGHPVFVRCHSSRTDQCPSCASLYARDWRHILFSGIAPDPYSSEEEQVEQAARLEGCLFLFLTLTAPAFGKVHRVGKSKDALTPCSCGEIHGWTDRDLAGVPLDPAHYEYGRQVTWNCASSALWAATRKRLERRLPGMEYAMAREWQRRGALHNHVLLRIPAPSHDLPVAMLAEAVRQVAREASTTQLRVSGSRVTVDQIRWGKESACDAIAPDADSTARTIGYLAKTVTYTLKSLEQSSASSHRENPAYATHLRSLARAAARMDHPGHRDGCSNRCHENWGATGRRIVTSPGWSLSGQTRRGLRRARQAYAREHGGVVEHMSPQMVEVLMQMQRAARDGRVWHGLEEAGLEQEVATRKTQPAGGADAVTEGAELLRLLMDGADAQAVDLPWDADIDLE